MTERTNISRRRFLEATGAAASAVALTGFTHREPEAASADESLSAQQQGGETLELINSTMSTLDPIAATDTASGVVIQQIFDALMNYPNGEIEVVPLLASDYQTSDDFTTYTFNLKSGITYHDGTQFSAQDLVYSFERLAASPNSQRSYFILDSIGVSHETETVTQDGEQTERYRPGSLAVSAPDDSTLRIQLDEPFHSTLPMLAYTSFAAIPRNRVNDVPGLGGEISQQEFANNPVGTGPFQFESYQTNTEARVSRFDDYYGDKAQIAGVHWQIIEDDNAVYNYAMNKNADAFNIPTPFYDPNKVTVRRTDDLGRQIGTYGPIRNGETVNYLAVATINAYYIGFNTNNVEKPARQAAAYVTNQQTFVDQVFKGRGRPAYHFTPPNIYPGGSQAYDQHAQQNYPYGYNQTRIQQAQQIMRDAGYGPNNRYQFTLTTYQSSSWQQIAQILRDQLASAFIDVRIEQAPFSTLIERGLNGNLQAYTLGWIMDWPAPDNFLQLLNPPQTDTSQPDAIAYTNWSGTPAAQRATEAWTTIQNNPAPTDQAEQARNEAYIAMEEANWEDVVFLNVYHATSERFWYDWLDIPRFGGAGTSRQKYNNVTIGQRN